MRDSDAEEIINEPTQPNQTQPRREVRPRRALELIKVDSNETIDRFSLHHAHIMNELSSVRRELERANALHWRWLVAVAAMLVVIGVLLAVIAVTGLLPV